MNYTDIEKIHAGGFITGEQRDKIVAHFNLKENGQRFLVIISFIGSILIAAGIILLISAHWREIPDGLKIATGLVLMLGTHGLGWWLREIRGDYRKTGEALQLLGSGLFLANIALVGQVYHLSSRTPNAFLLWWVGIAALPWLLRSKAQFVLLLAAFATWFGCELNQSDSLIYLRNEAQTLAYALLGLNFIGAGYWLRGTSFASFAPAAEKAGALGLLGFAYPLSWTGFLGGWRDGLTTFHGLLPALAVLAVLTISSGIRHLPGLTRQWRVAWAAALAFAAFLLCIAFFSPDERQGYWGTDFNSVNAAAVVAQFVFCLLQIQIGLRVRSPFLVNLGLTFIGLEIVSTYFGLFGTMAFTGMMFVVTGMVLIVFGIYLEWQRRKFMQQIKSSNIKEAQ